MNAAEVEALADKCGSRIVTLADVAPQPLRWLWRDLIPFGALTVLDGDPGVGKGLISADIAARVSTGRPMHGMSKGSPAADAIVVSTEDDTAITLRARYETAGADLSRIHVIDGDFMLDENGLALLAGLSRGFAPGLIIVDPLMNYLPADIDAYHDADVRRLLRPLAELARRSGAAIVIVRHLTKAWNGSDKKKGAGSIGIIGAARSGLLVENTNGSAYRLKQSKPNLAPLGAAVAYRIVDSAGIGKIEWTEAVSAPTRKAGDATERFVVDTLLPGLAENPSGFHSKTEARQAIGGNAARFGEAWERVLADGRVVKSLTGYVLAGSE